MKGRRRSTTTMGRLAVARRGESNVWGGGGGRRGEIRNAQFPRGMGAPKSIDFGRMSMMLRNISSPGQDHPKERVGGSGEWLLFVGGREYWLTGEILIKYFHSDLFQASIRRYLK